MIKIRVPYDWIAIVFDAQTDLFMIDGIEAPHIPSEVMNTIQIEYDSDVAYLKYDDLEFECETAVHMVFSDEASAVLFKLTYM